MRIYEFFDEDYNKALDTAEGIRELADKLVKCLNKAEEKEDNGGEVNFRRRAPRMRNSRGSYAMYPHMRGGYNNFTDMPPHMRGGYVVRPEEDDWAYSERYNW